MNTRLLRKIIGLILAALLLTSIVLLAGTTAAAQRRYHQRRVVIVEPIRPAQSIRPVENFGAWGPFGRPYHPFYDPYGRYDHYTFYRRSFGGGAPHLKARRGGAEPPPHIGRHSRF